MDLDAIKALPVSQLAAPDCALIVWATAPMLLSLDSVFDVATRESWSRYVMCRDMFSSAN